MNRNLFESKIKLAGLNSSDVASKLGISKASFSNKILGKRPFSLAESGKLFDILNLSNEDYFNIFFN